MRINSITIENFGAIGAGSVDFDALPSIVMISGRLRSAGASSNGAGKSTIFNAMTWALFGREIRNRAVTRIIRRGEKRCTVKVVLTLDDGQRLVIERSRTRSGSASLSLDGKEYDTNTGAQDVLERRFGFTFDQFTRTVVFGGDLSSFCRMTPANRTRMLEELLGISHYLEASDKAREAANDQQVELSTLNGFRESDRDKMASLRADVLELMKVRCRTEKKHERDIDISGARVARLAARCFTLAHSLGKAKWLATGNAEAYKAALADWKRRIIEAKDGVDRAERSKSKALSDLAMVEGEVSAARSFLKNLRQRDKDRVCPTCRRPLEGDHAPIDFKPHEDELQRLLDVQARRSSEAERCRAVLIAARNAVADIESHEPSPPKETEAVVRLLEKCAVAEAELSAALAGHRDLCESDPGDEYVAAIAKSMGRLRAFIAEMTVRDRRIDVLEKQTAVFTFWQRGMARDGIPAMLLESTAPLLNNAVKPLADVLTDGAYSIRFTGGVTRGKADFRVEASNIEGGESYEDLSKGELTRVDLCVLFAIRALMADRAGLRPEQVFIDELFDGLDEQGMEYAARLLRSKRLAKQIVFISHHHVLQDAADATVMVEKKNGVAVIRAGGSRA